MKLRDRTTLVARGVIVHENECLQCQIFQKSLESWPFIQLRNQMLFQYCFEVHALLLVHILP